MESVVLVIHLILALAIIALVLLQRSEGGGLGIGGGSGGLGGLASARGTANALTKMTGICAAGFFITSLTLGVIASHKHNLSQGILESVNETEIHAPVEDQDISAPTVSDQIEVESEVETETPVEETPKPKAAEGVAPDNSEAVSNTEPTKTETTEVPQTEESQGEKPTE
jgi:preprotein translocase subunit SecG